MSFSGVGNGSNIRALKVILILYTFLIIGGSLSLYVLPQWSYLLNSDPAYALTVIACACVAILLSLGIAQLCADVASITVSRVGKIENVEWSVGHAIFVTAVAMVVLCGVLFQNFYLTYMPIAGLVIYMLLHRHNRAYLSHEWLREFFMLVTTITVSALIAPLVPIVFAIVAGMLTGRYRYATIIATAYTAVLAIALVRLMAQGVNPVTVLFPGFTTFTVLANGQLSLQYSLSSPSDVGNVLTKVFQFLVTNSYIAFLEEQLGRATIPFVGPVLPTLLFVSLHVPSRVGIFFSPAFIASTVPEYAIVETVTIITMIAIAAIFLVRTYSLCGLIPSMLVHMLYNTYIDTVALNPVAAVVLILVLFVLYLALRGVKILEGQQVD